MTPARTIRFPESPRPVLSGASRAMIWRSRLRSALASILPAIMRDADITDELSGLRLTIRTGPLLTRISVNNRDFYFDRLTGRFDGTGSEL